jgi:hypothetical protein
MNTKSIRRNVVVPETRPVSVERRTAFSLIAVLILWPALAYAADAVATKLSLADDVVPAPDGYEPVTGHYVAAGTTALYISPYIWAGKVKGAEIEAGQPVQALGKPKGYDWLLVGDNGKGIGYVPLSAVSEVKP